MLADGQETKRGPATEDDAVKVSRSAFLTRAEILLVLLAFLALTGAMTWPWALHMGEAINPFGDVVLQMAVLRWDAHALVTNPAGLFEAPFFYPYAHSVAFSEHLLGETLITLPFLLITGNPALSYNINLLLSFVLTGFFTYLLMRDLTGSRAGGLLVGVAFAFCPFRFMQMGHLHMLATAWFPFTLWALFRWYGLRAPQVGGQNNARSLSSISWLLAAIGGLVVMGLSSVYYTFFLLLAVLLWAAWAGVAGLATGEWRAWRMPGRRSLLYAALGLVLAVAILLPVFLPYAQASADLGVVRTTYELDNWSAQWSYFGKVLQSNWLYAKVLAPNMATSLGERQLFFGIVPSFLALLGLVWGRGRHRFYFALLGIFALLMTFGLDARVPGTGVTVPLPYAFFYDFLPGFKALRVPVRFAVLLDFSIYVLAGYGLAVLLQRIVPVSRLQSRTHSRSTFHVSRFTPALLTAILTALILLEFANPLDVNNRRDVTAQIATIEPYGWLSRPENAGPVVELPFNPDQADVEYMLFDTRNWQPLMNGWSGFVPPGTVELSKALAAFPDPMTVSLLQGLEIRHVVVHLWQYPKTGQATFKKRLDGTKELELVDQAGDNYVYRLASNPWLRDLARQLGSDKTLWIGEARHGMMPTLEALAYALNRMGVRWEQMGGNINIGYRPIGQLPFGTFPDYALVPNDPTLLDAELMPVGLELDGEVMSNPAVRVLHSAAAGSTRSYDMLAPGAPALDPSGVQLAFGDGGIGFGAPPPSRDTSSNSPEVPSRELDLYFVSFAPITVTLKPQVPGQDLGIVQSLPSGVSVLTAPVTSDRALLSWTPGEARLVRVTLGPVGHEPEQPLTTTNLLPLEVSSSKTSSTLDTRMRAIAPSGGGDLTATIDIYVEPWGTHPNGHYGSWSVVLPGDGAAHDFTFHFDPLAKTVTTVRDGRPVQTFSWIGPPTQGDFRASLLVSDKAGVVADVPLYLFTVDGSQLADCQLEEPSLSIAPAR